MFYTHTQLHIFDVCECVYVCVVLAPFHNARSRRNCIFIAARCLYVLKSVLYLLFIYGLLLSAFLFSPLFASLLALPSLFFSRQLCRFLSKVLCFFLLASLFLEVFVAQMNIWKWQLTHETQCWSLYVCVDFGIGRNNDRDWYSALFRNNLHDS